MQTSTVVFILALLAVAFVVRLVAFKRQQDRVRPSLEYVQRFVPVAERLIYWFDQARTSRWSLSGSRRAAQTELSSLVRDMDRWVVPAEKHALHLALRNSLTLTNELWKTQESSYPDAYGLAFAALQGIQNELRSVYDGPVSGMRATNLGVFLFGLPRKHGDDTIRASRMAEGQVGHVGATPSRRHSQPAPLSQNSNLPEVDEVGRALLRYLQQVDDPSGARDQSSWEWAETAEQKARDLQRSKREEQRRDRNQQQEQQRQLREQRERRELHNRERRQSMYDYERQLYGVSSKQANHED
jgi:hypothetical protein